MTPPDGYLTIPEDYSRSLGGLAWSSGCEAIEYAAESPHIGLTFAMAGEVARFLEGFQAGGRILPFGYVLHLLSLLSVKSRPVDDAGGCHAQIVRLSEHFLRAGRPLRNAGAMFATLCRDVPRAPDAPDLRAVCAFLDERPGYTEPDRWGPVTVPSLEPLEFQKRVIRALQLLSNDELDYWLAHGRGRISDAGEQAVESLVVTRPRSLEATLALLERRPRLAEAAALAPQLSGALVLPARRLDPGSLPAGGYADIATRGQPEQILPSQLALDSLEFLRRFAEHELLYFHREEPRSAVDEELVLLVDQGVRTWGDVRLIVAGAALALARKASRRRIRLRIGTTGNGGQLVDANGLAQEHLGALLEASDLSPHPGQALELVLEDRPERLRDVVLLTHPRSLAEPDVAAAAEHLAIHTRLFAVSVEAAGQVELSELRGGTPIALGRCRVTIPPAVAPSRVSTAAPVAGGWTGDVEPIGFPFQLGAIYPIKDGLYDFDASGDSLLVATGLGLLHAWKVKGRTVEMLPRAMSNGQPLAVVHAVVGVQGGFVIGGRCGRELVAAHYGMAERTCTVYVLGLAAEGPIALATEWLYDPREHAVIVRGLDDRPASYVIGLGADRSEAVYRWDLPADAVCRRVRRTMLAADKVPQAHLKIVRTGTTGQQTRDSIAFDPSTGTFQAHTENLRWPPIAPLSDGQPMLKLGRILQAQVRGKTLAVLAATASRKRELLLFEAPSGQSIGSYPIRANVQGFAISRDGRRVARRVSTHQIHLQNVGDSLHAGLSTFQSRAHSRLDVRLGDEYLLVRAGRFTHLLCWSNGALSHHCTSDKPAADSLIRDLSTTSQAVDENCRDTYDSQRFFARATAFGLTVLVDVLSHVILLDRDDVVAATFYFFRGEMAGWLPDGTRLGEAVLIGGPSTPGAPARFAAALAAATARGGRPAR